MTDSIITIRPLLSDDHAGWRPLWDGYNAFYGRIGATALPEPITQATWKRFFAGHPDASHPGLAPGVTRLRASAPA